MAKDLVENLLKLESGVRMYDAMLNQYVFVVAPVMFIIADNPMSSDLCNHQGNSARRFCRMCMVYMKRILCLKMNYNIMI